MEAFSALLSICAGNSPVPGEVPAQRPVTRSFDVYFNVRPNKRLTKQLTEALRRLVANQREVMTILLKLLYVLNIKRNIF